MSARRRPPQRKRSFIMTGEPTVPRPPMARLDDEDDDEIVILSVSTTATMIRRRQPHEKKSRKRKAAPIVLDLVEEEEEEEDVAPLPQSKDWAISPNATQPLIEYARQQEVMSYHLDDSDPSHVRHTYQTNGGSRVKCGGIHTYMKGILIKKTRTYTGGRYVPKGTKMAKRTKWSRKKSKASEHKKGASNKIGNATTDAIMYTVRSGGVRPKKINAYASALLDWLARRGFELQAAELPVILHGINRVTRIDLVTLDPMRQGYVLWEIKCGWPPGADRSKSKMRVAQIAKQSCAPINLYHLQALYNKVGALSSGLTNIVATRVLHVFEAEIATHVGVEIPQSPPRKSSANKEVWNKEFKKIVSPAGEVHRVMRVIAYDQPRWCQEYEPVVVRNVCTRQRQQQMYIKE